MLVDGLDAWRSTNENVTNRDWPKLTLNDVRARLFRLIDATLNLNWMLLTKRPENIRKMWPMVREPILPDIDPGEWYRPNVWIGASAENQKYLIDRWEHLRDLPPVGVIFLSCEPLLGPLNLTPVFDCVRKPDLVIVGGESGPGARPCQIEWIRDIVRQCKEASVKVFVKQIGSTPMFSEADIWAGAADKRYDKKGGDIDLWPSDIQVREFPNATVQEMQE